MIEQRPERRGLRFAARHELERAARARAPDHADGTAEDLSAALAHGKARFGESELAASLLERRQRARQHQLIAREFVLAGDLGCLERVERQLELQAQVALAGGAHRLGESPGARAQRRFPQEPEELGGRPLCLSIDQHARRAHAELREAHSYVVQARAEHAGAAPGDVQAVAIERELGLDVLDTRPFGGVLQQALVQARLDHELPARRIGERKVVQIALQPQLDVARVPGEDAGDQPLARPLAHQCAERQVVRKVPGVGAVDHRGKVDAARALALVGVAAESIAAEIGVGERERRHLHAQHTVLAPPVELPVERVEDQARLRKDARQVDLGAARLQPQAPAGIGRLDAAGKFGEAGQRLARLEAEIEEAGARAVLRRRRDRPLPFEGQVAELAARLELERELAQLRRQRQRRGEVRERRELEHVRAQHAAFGLPGELEIHRRERLPAFRRHLELARRQPIAVGEQLGVQAAADRRELERRQLFAQRRHDVGERHVGGRLAQRAVLDLAPEAQRALAAPQVDRVIEPRPPCREIGVAELGVELAVPAADLRRALPGELRAQLDGPAERLGQATRKSEGVVLGAVGEPQVDPGKHERRASALFVAPFDLGIADLDLFLVEQPVAQAAFSRGRQLHAGDVQHAVGVAPHRQPRPFDAQRVQPQPTVRERAP